MSVRSKQPNFGNKAVKKYFRRNYGRCCSISFCKGWRNTILPFWQIFRWMSSFDTGALCDVFLTMSMFTRKRVDIMKDMGHNAGKYSVWKTRERGEIMSDIIRKARQRIRDVRRREVEVCVTHDGKPIENAQVSLLMRRHEFLFGCNCFPATTYATKEKTTAIRSFSRTS